ncbi:MAG: TGS domain-containing protein, partial [Rhodospirillaceae bacterium]|nr:TGS domain-containing protein [Rhodospirillaceae bacterium]
MVAITLPDGSVRSFDNPVSGAELAADIGPGLAKAALAIRLNGALDDLSTVIGADSDVAIITDKDEEALDLIRHDAAHVLAEAVQELWPGTQVTIGPNIESGFYYDFAREEPFTPEDLETIEKKMLDVIERNDTFTKEVWDRDKAVQT